MFALSDMITIEVIERSLANLRANPHHLCYILGEYSSTPFLRNIHGKDYIKHCMDLILNNKIQISPYYNLNNMQLPHISVVATYQEADQAIGDYVDSSIEELPPRTLGCFDAVSIASDNLSIFVPNSYEVSEFAFPNTYLCNGNYKVQISMTIPGDTQTQIYVKTTLPNLLAGWKIKTSNGRSVATINGSGNNCTVMIKIKSSGDIETHKLLCTVLRYCLRFGRIYLEGHNLYLSNTNQDMPVLEDESQMIFATVFMMSGKSWDFWIENENIQPDHINLEVDAVPVSDENGEEYICS